MNIPGEDDFNFMIQLFARGRLWITANERLFWAERARRVKEWRELTAWSARQRHLPKMMKARIVCELHFADSRRRDPANWADTAKACVDGLVDAGVFDDDSSKYVIGPDMRIGAVVPRQFRGIDLRIYPLGR